MVTNLRITRIRWSGVLERRSSDDGHEFENYPNMMVGSFGRRSSDDGHEFENYPNKVVRSSGAQELRRWSRI